MDQQSLLTGTTGTLWTQVYQDTKEPASAFGTHRAVAPHETLTRIKPLLPRAGITRLADVTGLDWIGMPVYQAIRPNSRNVSVSQGKGLTREQAQVSALMESLEGYHAEELLQPAIRATVGAMRPVLEYDPNELPVVYAPGGSIPPDLGYDPYAPPPGAPNFLRESTVVEWVSATNLCSGTATWVPKQLCELNYCTVERLSVPLFRPTSNGLASGNTMAEAVIHGLCEVIERDASWRNQQAKEDPERRIAIGTISSVLAQGLLERFARAGVTVVVVDVTGPVGLPCFEVYLDQPEAPVRYFGAGCHATRETALLRALTEAAQSRLAYIAGSRDDLYRRSYGGGTRRRASSSLEARGNFESAPSLSMTDWAGTLQTIAGRVRAVTGAPPLAVDLSRPDFAIPVVYVVAPGLHLQPPKRR